MSDHNPDTLDRDEHLENLIRDTLRGRAATVHDGPEWARDTGPTRRHTWLTVAASVLAVAVVAGGLLMWRQSDDSGTPSATTPAGREVPLPAAWRKALAVEPLRIQGARAQVQAVTAAGTLIATATAADGSTTLAVVPNGKTKGAVYRSATNKITDAVTDGRWLVFNASPRQSASKSKGPELVVVDLRTPRESHWEISTRTLPAGYTFWDGPQVQNGIAYVTAVPAAEAAKAEQQSQHVTIGKPGDKTPTSYPVHGLVVAYTLATKKHRIVGRSTVFDSDDDPRGVFWDNGRVRAEGVPGPVAPFTTRTGHYRAAVRNGPTWAWDATSDGGSIGWTDGVTTRYWRSDVAKTHSADLSTVVAVSGPYVFFTPANGTDVHLFVLDVRTGAYADTGLEWFGTRSGGTRTAIYYRPTPNTPIDRYETKVLDVRGLPQLRR